MSWRSHITKVDPLLKNVCFLGGRWGVHSYLASPKYNKKTDNFWNWPPLLVLTCWKFDNKLNIVFWNIIDECSFALIVDRHWHVLFLTYWPKNSKWRSGWFCWQSRLLLLFFQCWCRLKSQNEIYDYLTASKVVTEITRDQRFKICKKNDNKWHMRSIHIKY